MALTQMQIIQSLGEAMAWFEREINWGIPPTELRHLCGRIGELYAALITNGQMATAVNQKGYDVVSADGQRISVKTTAVMGTAGHITLNSNTLEFVDRVIFLRINTEEMQIETLLDVSKDKIQDIVQNIDGKRTFPIAQLLVKPSTHEIKSVKEVSYQNYTIRELETGSIELELGGENLYPVKPILRRIANELNISLLNNNGNLLNTRQLGSQIIRHLQSLTSTNA